jgi:hypothetical protein
LKKSGIYCQTLPLFPFNFGWTGPSFSAAIYEKPLCAAVGARAAPIATDNPLVRRQNLYS